MGAEHGVGNLQNAQAGHSGGARLIAPCRHAAENRSGEPEGPPRVVEMIGFEPTTPSLRTRCSPN